SHCGFPSRQCQGEAWSAVDPPSCCAFGYITVSDPIKHTRRYPVQLHRVCLRDVSPTMPQGNSREAVMMQLVTHNWYGEFVDDLVEMHRLRYRVFKKRLGWDVQVSGDTEIDEFDALHPAYLLQRGSDDHLQGCVRLLPSTGPNMLRDAFPALLHGRSA